MKSGESQGAITIYSAASLGIPGARFIADPFFLNDEAVLFEVYSDQPKGKYIGAATLDHGILKYQGPAIHEKDEKFSFPFTFRYGGYDYCLPERTTRGEIKQPLRIYRRIGDSLRFEPFVDLGVSGSDPVLIEHKGTWYLFVKAGKMGVALYFSDSPTSSSWTLHPSSPIAKGSRTSRMAGRPIVGKKRVLLFQDGKISYGNAVRSFVINKLSKKAFTMTETTHSPVVSATGSGGWNNDGMHHIDLNSSIGCAVVDGHVLTDVGGIWSIALVQDVQTLKDVSSRFPDGATT